MKKIDEGKIESRVSIFLAQAKNLAEVKKEYTKAFVALVCAFITENNMKSEEFEQTYKNIKILNTDSIILDIYNNELFTSRLIQSLSEWSEEELEKLVLYNKEKMLKEENNLYTNLD